MIHVCSLARLHDTVEEIGARHIVTLLRDSNLVQRPRCVAAENHLILGMDDIAAPIDGYTHPAEEHVTQLIEFVRGSWDRTRTDRDALKGAGISRSTAAAFTAACALNPKRSEADIARAIRSASATAMPNADAGVDRRPRARPRRTHGRGGRVARPRPVRDARRTVPARSRITTMADTPLTPIEIGLTAAIVAVEADEPFILVAGEHTSNIRAGLPFGTFDPLAHRTFEIGLRAWVAAQTAITVGYVEQLYTFGDRGRHARPGDTGPHMISVGYLALTRMSDNAAALRAAGASFEPWYRFFPWEDWREGRPGILDATIVPLLEQWAKSGRDDPARPLGRRERLRLCFGGGGSPWDEEKVLDRYELLYEAGLVEEARRDGREATVARTRIPALGESMRFDHRRILATAIARLRAKLKYRPVVFELMPAEFTLTELQRTVEAISGRHLHKQNFRRLVETAALVEPTGETSTETGGRPAALFRFRREAMQERPAPGLRVGRRG